jgi:hypothetical protein
MNYTLLRGIYLEFLNIIVKNFRMRTPSTQEDLFRLSLKLSLKSLMSITMSLKYMIYQSLMF